MSPMATQQCYLDGRDLYFVPLIIKTVFKVRNICSSYPLLLAGHKRLEAGCHAKSQLVNEGRLILAVDLHLNPSFK